MKILMITHLVPYPPHDGPSLRNFNLLKECSKNHEIHLLTFYRKAHGHNPENLKYSIDELKKYCKDVKVFAIPTEDHKLAWYLLLLFNIFSLSPYSVWAYWSPKMVRAIKRKLQEVTFDVVEIGEIGLANYSKLFHHTPTLLVHHNIESQVLNRRSKIQRNPIAKIYLRLQARKLKRLERKACESIDYHTTVSKDDKDTLLRINHKARVQVVPNGVDVSYFQPSEEATDDCTLVFAGTMTWYPNLDAMLYFKNEIWPILKEQSPEISIRILGKHPPKELLDFAKHNKGFNVMGFVEDVRPYIAKATIYVVPIRTGGGSRLKILDALAMGKAVVSTSIGCEGIRVTNGKDIVISDTPQGFANSVLDLLQNSNKRNQLEKKGRELVVKEYSWSKIALQMNDAYVKSKSRKGIK